MTYWYTYHLSFKHKTLWSITINNFITKLSNLQKLTADSSKCFSPLLLILLISLTDLCEQLIDRNKKKKNKQTRSVHAHTETRDSALFTKTQAITCISSEA